MRGIFRERPGTGRTGCPRMHKREREERRREENERSEPDETREEQVNETGILFEKSARPTECMVRVFGVP